MYSRSMSLSWDESERNCLSEKIRARSNSGVRLDYYQRLVYKTILKYQVLVLFDCWSQLRTLFGRLNGRLID